MRITIERPHLGKALAGTEQAIQRAVTAGMRDAADGLKTDLRDEVVAAGLGERLARSWHGTVFPQAGESLEAAAYVWSRAPKIIDAFDRGAVIRSTRGLFLAIPTPEAGRAGRGANGAREKITPAGWERRTGMTLRFIFRPGRISLLVAENARLGRRGQAMPNRRRSGQATIIVFVLLPQVALRKRLGLQATATRQASRVPALIAGHWHPR